MNQLVLIYALDQELKPLLKKTDTQGRLFGVPITLCQTGMGMGNAHEGCERLLNQFSPPVVLSVGYAGGLKGGLKTGDLIFPTEVRSESGDRFPPNPDWSARLASAIEKERIPCHAGPLLSVFNPLRTRAEKEKAGERGAIAIDMETAAVAAVCQKKGIPFASLRVIYDPLEADLLITDEGKLSKRAFFRIPQLFWRNRICQRNLAKVVTRLIRGFA